MEEGAADDAVVGRDVEHILVAVVWLLLLMLCLQEHVSVTPRLLPPHNACTNTRLTWRVLPSYAEGA